MAIAMAMKSPASDTPIKFSATGVVNDVKRCRSTVRIRS
jgi:hypothetical protein